MRRFFAYIYSMYLTLQLKYLIWRLARNPNVTNQQLTLMLWKMKRILDQKGIDTKDIFKDL